MKLGEILVAAKAINQEQVDDVVSTPSIQPFGSRLIEAGLVENDTVARALAKQGGVPAACEKHFALITSDLAKRFPESLAKRHRVCPIGQIGDHFAVAMADPTDSNVVAIVEKALGHKFQVAVAPEVAIQKAIKKLYSQPQSDQEDISIERSALDTHPVSNLEGESGGEDSPKAKPNSSQQPEASSGLAANPFKKYAPFLGLVLVVAVGVFVVKQTGGKKVLTGTEVSGTIHLDHVGAAMVLPSDWRHVPEYDIYQNQSGMIVKGSWFYRGGTSASPELALGVVAFGDQAARVLPSSFKNDMLDVLLRAFEKKASSLKFGEFRMHDVECWFSDERTVQAARLGRPMRGECSGAAKANDVERAAVLQLWHEAGRWALVAVLHEDDYETVASEIEGIVHSVELDNIYDD